MAGGGKSLLLQLGLVLGWGDVSGRISARSLGLGGEIGVLCRR
jgi:hypothetical protein